MAHFNSQKKSKQKQEHAPRKSNNFTTCEQDKCSQHKVHAKREMSYF